MQNSCNVPDESLTQGGNSMQNSCNVPDESHTQGGNLAQISSSVPDESVITQGAIFIQPNTHMQPGPQLTLQSADPSQNSVQKQSYSNFKNTPDASVNNTVVAMVTKRTVMRLSRLSP